MLRTSVEMDRRLPKNTRDLIAPANLEILFWPLRRPLGDIERYQSTKFWFQGMKPATLHAYRTHLRLFCRFYNTDPDVLVQFSAQELKLLLDAYLSHLLRVAVKVAGKPKPGQVSVNSIVHYFTGLRTFFVDEHEKEINWKRYEKKFPEKVASNLRGYYREEVQRMYKAADIFDKPLVILEYCTSVRVGAIGPMQFDHLLPIPELPGYCFLKVYPESAADYYYVVVTPEFMTDLEELKKLRDRWGEKITGKSFIICSKFDPHSKMRQEGPLGPDGLRGRMRRLMKKAGVDLERIQPNHGMRKAGNTAMKNAHVDKNFKEMFMGHSSGLDDIYYDIENPESRKAIAVEFMKAADALNVSDENRVKQELAKVKAQLAQKDQLNEKELSKMVKKMVAQYVDERIKLFEEHDKLTPKEWSKKTKQLEKLHPLDRLGIQKAKLGLIDDY